MIFDFTDSLLGNLDYGALIELIVIIAGGQKKSFID